MNTPNKTPIIFIIIIIIIAAIALVKFSNDKNAIDNTPTATSTPLISNSPSTKLPPGSTPPGSPELIKGKSWVWERTVMNDDSIVIPNKSEDFIITFNDDGTVSGRTDCNSFSGSYEIGSDGAIKFDPLAMTKMFCEGSKDVTFVGALSQVQSYSVDTRNDKLLLYYNEGLIILYKFVFEAL